MIWAGIAIGLVVILILLVALIERHERKGFKDCIKLPVPAGCTYKPGDELMLLGWRMHVVAHQPGIVVLRFGPAPR